MKKSVVIVGVFTPGSSNIGVARAFESLGWKVTGIPYRDMASIIGVDATSYAIINSVEKLKPDLTLFCKFNGFNSDILSKCSEHSETCLWFMDSFQVLRSNCPEVISHCHNASFSVHWPGVADELKELGVTNCYGLTEGCDEEEFKPIGVVDKFKSDVSFIGTKNDRHVFVDALIGAGYSVNCYGNGYDSYVTGDDFNAVCSSSKMVLNLPTYPGARDYFSDRLVRTLATGACSLTLYTPGMEKYFNNKEHLVWFNSIQECLDIVKENIDRVKEIGDNGREHFLNNYTCKHFVQKLLEFGNIN